MNLTSGPVDRTSSSQTKITLFRSLFRGRDDVYPRRFESRKTGKSGHAPACGNEWVRGICEKPRIERAQCPNRRFLPVTDDVIRVAIRANIDKRMEPTPGPDAVSTVLPRGSCVTLPVHALGRIAADPRIGARS